MAKTPPFWLETVLNTLASDDLCIVPNAFDLDLCATLRADLAETPLRPAAVGRGNERLLASGIRNDSSHWLDGAGEAQCHYLAAMSALQEALNQRFYFGLAEYEAHYARYPAGGFYRRHYDSFRGNNPRRVTTVFYLNESWQPEDGGALCIYRNEQDTVGLNVLPEVGTLVIFISEQLAHEVKPAHRERLSIAGWFRTRE